MIILVSCTNMILTCRNYRDDLVKSSLDLVVKLVLRRPNTSISTRSTLKISHPVNITCQVAGRVTNAALTPFGKVLRYVYLCMGAT